MQTYQQVIDYLYDQLPYYQRSGPSAYKDNLDNSLALDRMYNHPHRKFKSIHVAGTNGKGSVSHMLCSILMEAGYRVGLYTSPHLLDFRERIRVNGQPVDEQFVVDFTNDFIFRNQEIRLEPSFFELTVMMAFEYFARQQVDVAVIEVGLGGRLDSTNIISPVLSVITNISYDHMALLGDTLGRIALEKAGIIKTGIPVVVGENHPETTPIFEGIAMQKRAPMVLADQLYNSGVTLYSSDGKQVFTVRKGGDLLYEHLRLDLMGKYQSKNICTVLASIDQLRDSGWNIDEGIIRAGLENVASRTGLLGRWQILGANPRIICDTGHNEAGIREVIAQLIQTPSKTLRIVFGMVNDKDVSSVMRLLPGHAVYYFTNASIPRAMPGEQLAEIAGYFQLKGEVYETVEDAIRWARTDATADDTIFIGGSTFVVAEALELFR